MDLQMSMEGVRTIAKALEENSRRGISHVYVHSEGRIDALGRRSKGTHEVTLETNYQYVSPEHSDTYRALWSCCAPMLLEQHMLTTMALGVNKSM